MGTRQTCFSEGTKKTQTCFSKGTKKTPRAPVRETVRAGEAESETHAPSEASKTRKPGALVTAGEAESETCPERSEQNTLSVGDSGERDTYPERSDPKRSEQNTEDSPGEGAQDELYLADVESLHSGSSGCDMSTPRGVPRTPSPDPHAFDVEFEDFDYELEINEFENLRQFDIDEPFDINEFVMDLDSIASIDFSKYV